MVTVLEKLQKPIDPTDEEFVDAVIRMHERIRSQLQAFSRGARRPESDAAVEAADIIRAYCLSYGVDAARGAGTRSQIAL